MAVTTRLAQPDEFGELESRLKESGFSMCNFRETPCIVAEAEGELVGMLPLRLLTEPAPIWYAEPMLIWTEAVNTRRRAMYLLWKAAEEWISSEKNRTGVRRYLAITFDTKAKQLFAHAGLHKLSAEDTKPFASLSADNGAEFFFQSL